MLPVAERFEDWLHAPMSHTCSDPRVAVRRVRPEEFPVVFDTVNAGFGVTRPAVMFDWLYRRNPLGLARCLMVNDVLMGRVVSVSADWPWPVARGETPLPGCVNGDLATVPDWQGKRLYGVLDEFRAAHPWAAHTVRFAWPNARSEKAIRRLGQDNTLAGHLESAVLIVDPRSLLERRGVAPRLAAAAGRIGSCALAAWTAIRLPAERSLWTAPVDGFDSAFDELLARAVPRRQGYWCPHTSVFLNWRYLEHPVHRFVGFAVARRDAVLGYAVLRLDGVSALLMEFVVDPAEQAARRVLLRRLLSAAREAGCASLRLLASASWPHWSFMSSVGAFRRTAGPILQVMAPDSPELRVMENWLLSPGDVDAL